MSNSEQYYCKAWVSINAEIFKLQVAAAGVLRSKRTFWSLKLFVITNYSFKSEMITIDAALILFLCAG